MDTTKTFWLPTRASTFADVVDPAFNVVMWMSLFFLLAVTFGVIYFVVKFRRKHPDQIAQDQITHNFHLELWWTIIPFFIVLALFWIGFKGYLSMSIAPHNATEVKVIGQKWSWIFEYPNGTTSDTLVVPVNEPIKLIMSSRDILHSFWVPAFRVKMDLVPNRYTSLWFEATSKGEFPIRCTEYCGTGHSDMLSSVRVVDYTAYEEWLQNATSAGEGLTPVEFGQKLFASKGCSACHNLDGTNQIGPTWKGVWGIQRKLKSGATVKVDENYIRNSILNPAGEIAEGYQPVMPTYKGIITDAEIDAIIEFYKSLQ